jgi:hypothetical protein
MAKAEKVWHEESYKLLQGNNENFEQTARFEFIKRAEAYLDDARQKNAQKVVEKINPHESTTKQFQELVVSVDIQKVTEQKLTEWKHALYMWFEANNGNHPEWEKNVRRMEVIEDEFERRINLFFDKGGEKK